MVDHLNCPPLYFEAAVQHTLTLMRVATNDNLVSHDFMVEVVTTSKLLNSCDIVMDFRDLEKVLQSLLNPFQGQPLSDFSLNSIMPIAAKLAQELVSKVPAPARLVEVSVLDSCGRRLTLHI